MPPRFRVVSEDSRDMLLRPVVASSGDAHTLFGDRIPESEKYRTHYGRSLDLVRIDSAIRSANNGFMRPLTDLARETVSLDGHLSAVLNKRLNRAAALDWVVTPAAAVAEGTPEHARAKVYADVVRDQLKAIPHFRSRILDLAWGVFDGRAALEIEWRFKPGAEVPWQVADLHWIHPRRLSYGPDRELRVVDTYRDSGDFRPVGFPLDSVPWKFVQYTPRLFSDYPEREGLAPRCLYWSFFQRFGTRERMSLLEVFGKPWRIIEAPATGPWNDEALAASFAQIDALGAQSTATLPPGYKIQIPQPTEGAGQVHDQAILDARSVISKLVLGNTGTTDAIPTGLGSSVGDAHLSEEDLVIASDVWRLSETIEDAVTDAIIAVNFGTGALDLAPCFRIATDPPADRTKEIERIGKALDAGLVLSVEEVYERAGYRLPDQSKEPVLRRVAVEAEPGLPAPPPIAAVVYPTGQAPPGGEVAPAPTDPAALPPPVAPAGTAPAAPPAAPPVAPETPGQPSAPAAAPDTSRADLAARMTELGIDRCEHGYGNRCRICGVERVRGVELDEDGAPKWKIEWREIPRAMRDGPMGAMLADGEPDNGRDGGAHWHGLDRARLSTTTPGQHAHLFDVDGVLVVTGTDGAHVHELYDQADEQTGYRDGAHVHGLSAAGADLRTEPDGEHEHDLLAAETATDGAHRHKLVLPDGRVLESLSTGEAFERMGAALSADRACCPHEPIALAARQPSTVYGSPESMVDRGVWATAPVTEDWSEQIARAVAGLSTASDILRALRGVRLDHEPFAEIADREMVHSAMLGALDSDFESETGDAVKPVAFKDPTTSPSFAERAYEDAVAYFESKGVMTRAEFDRLSVDAKKRAFTVARLADRRMIQTVQRELSRQVRAGANLAEFDKFAKERLIAAGWTPANPSHVETIYRTNVVNAYSSGRFRQMTDPAVLAKRPLWQILTVNDGPPRQRAAHRALHGVVLRADDPFWKRAYPPFGFNCFMPETEIQGRIRGASRAFYSGETVQLTTAEGRRLTVTANHPVLTAQGFVPARAIREGDELVCYRGEPGVSPLRAAPERDEHHEPASAHKVFRALSQAGFGRTTFYRAEDFHGEAARFDGEIDIVGSYLDLLTHAQAAGAEHSGESVLVPAAHPEAPHPRARLGDLRVQRDGPTAARFPGGSALRLDASAIHSAPLETLRFGPAAELNARVRQEPGQSRSADALLLGELLHGRPGAVTMDKVVGVRKGKLAGHVYDFESETGLIVADGILTSNCRCRVRAVSRGNPVNGSTLSGVPDEGFASGVPALL
jgi:phage gp29-like protein